MPTINQIKHLTMARNGMRQKHKSKIFNRFNQYIKIDIICTGSIQMLKHIFHLIKVNSILINFILNKPFKSKTNMNIEINMY